MQFFALLDSQSLSGAYRFLIRPGAETTIEIENHLFFRKPVQVLGLAPLTSMFWRDENNQRPPNDKRPEVHDSDTLLIKTAEGENEVQTLRQVDHVTTHLFPGSIRRVSAFSSAIATRRTIATTRRNIPAAPA